MFSSLLLSIEIIIVVFLILRTNFIHNNSIIYIYIYR